MKTKQTVKSYLNNLYLKLRYNLFKKWLKPFKEGEPTWQENWDNPEYEIEHGDFYGSIMYKHKDCVYLNNDKSDPEYGLHLKVIAANKEFSNWNETKFCNWITGFVNYKKRFTDISYGRWVFDVRLPKDSFAALWFLRYPHPPLSMQFEAYAEYSEGKTIRLLEKPLKKPSVNWWVLNKSREIVGRVLNYSEKDNVIELYDFLSENIDGLIYIGSDHITPEVDLMEVMTNNKVRHTLHYGFTNEKYVTHSVGSDIEKPDFSRDYKFAVDILPNKYIFYIDGIKTAEYEVAVYDKPLYPILNNAVYSHVTDTSKKIDDFIIKSIKYYKLNSF